MHYTPPRGCLLAYVCASLVVGGYVSLPIAGVPHRQVVAIFGVPRASSAVDWLMVLYPAPGRACWGPCRRLAVSILFYSL